MHKKLFEFLWFKIWQNVHKFPREVIETWQSQELQKIFNIAYSNSHLYRTLYLYHGVKPNSIKSLSDIEKFPIIDKNNFLHSNVEDYIALERVMFHTWRYTSGTSGQPFSCVSIRNPNSLSHIFLTYRFLFWNGFTIKQILNDIPFVSINIIEGTGTYGPRKIISYKDIIEPNLKLLKEVSEHKPLVIEAFPSSLIEYAKVIKRYPTYRCTTLKYAISYGEKLEMTQRNLIEEALGCEVYDRYGLEEFGTLGTECRLHDGFHINEESFFIEILDENNKPLPDLHPGKVVVTDFRNQVMPYLRYETGDIGYLRKDVCPCGIPTERLYVDGRLSEFLKLPHKKIHALEFYKIMSRYPGTVLQYQVTHKANYKILISLVTSAGSKDLLNSIAERVRLLVGSKYEVEIEIVSEIKKTAGGKVKLIINLIS